MTSKVLALDLGTHTGFAVGVAAEPSAVISGVMDFSPGKFSGGGMRYVKFEAWLAKIIADTGANEVVFEGVRRHIGTDAAHIYGGFLAALSAFCEKRALPYAGVPVQTIKKWATGKGNAGKPLMISTVVGWGYTGVTDDNQADAICLLHQWISTR